MRGVRTFIGASLLTLASRAASQAATFCPKPEICYGLNIPSQTAQSANGDIFFKMSAPASYEWVALGQGSSMAGSNIFVAYVSSSGTNVTLAPLTGVDHSLPGANANAQVSLLEGSGVFNGTMVANVKCANCQTWPGGSMDFAANSGNWIWAAHSVNGPKLSDDASGPISQHDRQGVISLNLSRAKGGSDANPLLQTSLTGPSSASQSDQGARQRRMLIAHGTLAVLAFIVFFPSGAIILRVSSFPGAVRVHVAVQFFAYMLYSVALVLGAIIAHREGLTGDAHPILGIVIFIMVFIQPFFGFVHHRLFRRYGTRTIPSYVHIWLGRLLISLGILNGALGFRLADSNDKGSRTRLIVYCVVGLLVWVCLVSCCIFSEQRKKGKVAETSTTDTNQPRPISLEGLGSVP